MGEVGWDVADSRLAAQFQSIRVLYFIQDLLGGTYDGIATS